MMSEQTYCPRLKSMFFRFFIVVFSCLMAVPCMAGQQIVGWGQRLMPGVPLTETPIKIAPGAFRTFAIVAPGTIVCWGDNSNGYNVWLGVRALTNAYGTPPAGDTFTDVVAGVEQSVALRADGTLVTWGDNWFGQVTGTPQMMGIPFTAIATFHSHCLALRANGAVAAWGANGQGQCTVPDDLEPCRAISCGTRHSLTLSLYGGVIRGWGSNVDDTLPVPVYCGQSMPPAGEANAGFRAITSGDYFNVAIRADNSLAAWGRNNWNVVTTVPAGTNYIAVAACFDYCSALRTDGSIVSWGRNTWAPAGNDFVSLTSGGYTTCAVRANGTFVIWGSDNQGQGTPPIGNNYAAVSAGSSAVVALKSDGSLAAFGSFFTPPPAGNNYIAVASGNTQALALMSAFGIIPDRSINAWGSGGASTPPAPPATTFPYKAIAASPVSAFNLAVKNDGSLVGWGVNNLLQTSPLPSGSNFVAVAAGANHGLALRSNGTLAAWGSNTYNQVFPLPEGNNFVAIAAGWYHNVALRSDGSIVSWGKDDNNQVTATPPGTNFIAITAGDGHSVALTSERSLVAWGSNQYGQVSTVPAGNNFVAISATANYTVALRETNCSLILTGDFNYDCAVDIGDIRVLAQNWMDTDCISPLWCSGADADKNRTVNFSDFAALAQNWSLVSF